MPEAQWWETDAPADAADWWKTDKPVAVAEPPATDLPAIPEPLPQPPAAPVGSELERLLASESAPSTPLFVRPGVLGRSPASIPEAFQAAGGQLLHPIKSTEAAIEQFTGPPKFAGPYAPPVQHVSEILELGPKIPKIPQQKGVAAQVGAGAVNAVSSFVDIFLTPGGAATLGIASLPQAAKKAVLAEFAAGMAANAPDQLREGIELARAGKFQEASERLTSGTGEVLLSGLVASQIPQKLPREIPTTPQQQRAATGAPPVTPESIATARPETARPVLELEAKRAAGVTPSPEPFLIETVDLKDRRVYGPDGTAGIVTFDGINMVEAETGKGTVTWRKDQLDQKQLFADYPELKEPVAEKAERFVEERPPDVIDMIEQTLGTGAVISGKGMHEIDPNFPKNGFELNRTKGWPKWFKRLFTYKGGRHPADVLGALQREGHLKGLPAETGDALAAELFTALENRKSGKKVQTHEAELIEKQAAEAEATERAEKIVEVKFENEERAAIAESEKLGVKAQIVDILPEDPNQPFARAIPRDEVLAVPDGKGGVVLNRPVLNRFLREIAPEDRADAVRALVHEEVVHGKVTDVDATSYWNALTAAEKALVTRRYGGPKEGRPALTDSQLGHEALRGRLQQLAGMTPREVFGLRGVERLTVKTILALERVIFNLRRALGTKASALQKEMLDRVQRSLDAAKEAAAQEAGVAPAAIFRRREGELPLEEGKPGEERRAPPLPTAPAFESLSADARRAALGRQSVTAADIGWRAADEPKHPNGPAYRAVPPELRDAARLGEILTEGARIRTATPSVTRRVTALLNNRTGTVDLVSTFKEHEATMLHDPNKLAMRRPHVRLEEVLARKDREGKPLYTVTDNYLLEQPVKDFRQRFDSVEHYDAQFRNEVRMEHAARERGIEPQPAAVEFEGEQPRAVAAVEPEQFGPTGELLPTEAGSVYDHLRSTVGKIETVDDVTAAFAELRERPNMEVIGAYRKLFEAVRDANPDLSPEAAMAKVIGDVYESAQASPTKEAFVARTIPRADEVLGREVPPRDSGTEAKSAQLEPPAAFFRNSAAKGKHAAERLIAEPARWYSEWMTDRLARVGGRLTKAFSGTVNRIISRERELYGGLTPVLDPARKEAGKVGRATTWFNRFAEHPTPETGIRNAAPALEGTIQVPAFAQKLRSVADAANRAIGQLYVGISALTAPGGKFQRNITGFGYDLIREGHGPIFDRWVKGVAAANGKHVADVRRFFADWKALLDDPTTGAAAFEKVNQDFARVFPKAITDVRDSLGNWQPVVHADLFNYLENAAQRATHTRSLREVFPNTPAGHAAFERAMKAIRADTPGSVHADLDGLIRALNGHPTDNYANLPFLSPTRGPGALFDWLNKTIGNVAAKHVLSSQMLTQLPETFVGAAPVFLGAKRYVRGLIAARQLWPQLEREGKRNAVMYDWSFDPASPVRSVSRIYGNVISKAFAEQFLNEVQEGAAAATAKIVTDDIRTGNLSSWDRRMLPQTFRAMGFEKSQAADMLAGRAPHLLEQFERKAAAFLTGGNKAIAQGSRLGANRLFNSVFRFQSYPMMKMNQLRKVMGGWGEAMQSGTLKEKVAATELLVRFVTGSTLQGTLTVGVMGLFTGGLAGLNIRRHEADDNKAMFLAESAVATMAGPLYAVFRGARSGGVKGVGEQAARMFFPWSMMSDFLDMAGGEGQYKDLSVTDKIGRYVRQKTPGTQPIRVALSIAGLSQDDVALDQSIKAFRRWNFTQPRAEKPGQVVVEDARGPFRTAMKKAALALQKGDADGVRDALGEALGEAAALPPKPGAKREIAPAARLASSLRARKILQTNDRAPYFDKDWNPRDPALVDALTKRIGEAAVERLKNYDAMLEQVAEAVGP